MGEYNAVYAFCKRLEKEINGLTGTAFLAVPYTEGARVGFIVARKCTIIFQADFDIRRELSKQLADTQKQVQETVDALLRESAAAYQ